MVSRSCTAGPGFTTLCDCPACVGRSFVEVRRISTILTDGSPPGPTSWTAGSWSSRPDGGSSRGWANVPVHPLLGDGHSPSDALRNALSPFRDELRRYPLYISIDKDVLTPEDASVNWDSGLLRLSEAVTTVETFLAAAKGRLAGAISWATGRRSSSGTG